MTIAAFWTTLTTAMATRAPHPWPSVPIALGLALASASCAGRITPCAAPDACGSQRACIAGRCRPAAAEPAPPDTRRLVVAPTAVAYASSTGDAGIPGAIAFGAESSGSIVLLLRFPTPWGPRARIASAFLTLDAASGAMPEPAPVPISVARILDPWTPDGVTWGRQPKLSAPELVALARTAPPSPLRIDVTGIVERWARARPDDQGIALVAAPRDAFGATYETGTSGGAGPRLEVYLR